MFLKADEGILLLRVGGQTWPQQNGSAAKWEWIFDKLWLRTNGVNTNGAAAEVMSFDGSGKRYALALLRR